MFSTVGLRTANDAIELHPTELKLSVKQQPATICNVVKVELQRLATANYLQRRAQRTTRLN